MLGDVDSVFAMARTALADIEAEDTATALLNFRSGALGVIEATTATRPTDLEAPSPFSASAEPWSSVGSRSTRS